MVTASAEVKHLAVPYLPLIIIDISIRNMSYVGYLETFQNGAIDATPTPTLSTIATPQDLSDYVKNEINVNLVPNITAELQSVQTTFDTYISSTTSAQPLLSEQNGLNTAVRDKQHRLNELNQLDETYTQSYLDFKANPPAGGFFSKFGLRTTQDWTIAFFYLSFTVFSIIILLYGFVKSQQKIYAFFFTFTLLCIFVLLVTVWISYYG
jgi:hypothetical protein